MRAMLLVGAFLVFVAGIQLYVFSGQTDHYFSWTIDVPLTAAFLGAFYFTSLALAILSAGEEYWANARVGVPGVILFVVMTLVATLLHIDKFHFHSTDSLARGAAWLWLAVYVLEPPVLVAIYRRQLREPGRDPDRRRPTPGWYRGAISLQGAAALVVGLLLAVAPGSSSSVWPWSLTPLTARAIAAWLLGFGLVLVAAVGENDWDRLRAASASYAVLGVLQLAALARYPDAVDWGTPKVWIYAGYLLVSLGAGVVGSIAQVAGRAQAPA